MINPRADDFDFPCSSTYRAFYNETWGEPGVDYVPYTPETLAEGMALLDQPEYIQTLSRLEAVEQKVIKHLAKLDFTRSNLKAQYEF